MRLLALIACRVSTTATVAVAQASAFVSTAEINQASLNATLYKTIGRFYAHVRVKNKGDLPESLTIWTDPGWSWIADSYSVVVDQEAQENSPSQVTLKPGQVYEGNLELAVNPRVVRR